MGVFAAIVPVFMMILLGWALRGKGLMPATFMGPANRLVYYLAIPAMIFSATARADLRYNFNPAGVIVPVAAAALVYGLAWGAARLYRLPDSLAASFIAGSGHGNLGYIGLPVTLYCLGEQGLVTASVITGFLTILQNVLSAFVLQPAVASGGLKKRLSGLGAALMVNPIVISAMAGLVVSFLAMPVFPVVQRSLDMLSQFGPPLALLLIGASLSFKGMGRYFKPAMAAVAFKLVVLPALGLFGFCLLGLEKSAVFLPGMILLASPTATVTYVMARALNGEPAFSAAVISASTLGFSISFTLWLFLTGHWF